MLKFSGLIVTVALFASPASSFSAPQRMTNAEYTKALNRLQSDLAQWETILQKIDPGSGDASYNAGKLSDRNRTVGLIQTSNLRQFIARERNQRSIYRELELGSFLSELSADFYALSLQGALNNVSVESVGHLSAEIGQMQKALMGDGLNGVKDMENTGCGAAGNN